jgi:ABC-type multidrug transport system fused ATPase/permease subunit
MIRCVRRPPASVIRTVQLLRMVPATGTGLTWAVALLILVAGLAPVGAIVTSGLVVQSIAQAGSEGLGSAAGHRAAWLLAAFAALFVVSQSAARLSAALAATVGARMDGQLQRRAIRAVNGPAGVAHLDDPGVADSLSRITGVAMGGYTPGGAVTALTTTASQLVQSLAALAVLSLYRWWLAAAVFAAGLWWSREFRRDYLRQTEALAGQASALRRSGYLRGLVLQPAAAKEIRLFGLAGWLVERFRAEWDAAMEVVWRQREKRRLPLLAALLALTGTEFAAFALLGRDAVRGVIALGAAVIFLRSIGTAGSRFAVMGNEITQLAYGLSVLPAVTAVERAAARAVERPGPRLPRAGAGMDSAGMDSAGPDSAGLDITLEDVTFRYPGSQVPVLDGLCLTVPAARSLAVVGANGAGKTTLIKLICRFYDPDEGTIRAGGTDLRDLDARDWQRRIAAVFQDFQRFELSARDNIAFGAVQLAGDERALERAAQRAGILDKIKSLPGGWDTPLARHLDGGADLSGGEWQRVALARALLALDGGARLLILDEPTASLDARAEAAFYDRFLDLTQNATTILISHRFSTVRRADLICVLADGAVAELGSHAELLAAGGHYARMYTAQSARFTGTAP